MKRLEDMTEPELSGMMKAIAANAEAVCRMMGIERPHFAIVVFNDPKVAQYVSNCERGCMIEAMRETADRLEKHQDVPR